MQKIVNGKKYDTETAVQITTNWNGRANSDFGYCYEILYRTTKGNYFIWGEGGASSKYSEAHGNMRGPGETIIPVSESEARVFCEKNGSPEEYAGAFGEPESA